MGFLCQLLGSDKLCLFLVLDNKITAFWIAVSSKQKLFMNKQYLMAAFLQSAERCCVIVLL